MFMNGFHHSSVCYSQITMSTNGQWKRGANEREKSPLFPHVPCFVFRGPVLAHLQRLELRDLFPGIQIDSQCAKEAVIQFCSDLSGSPTRRAVFVCQEHF